VRCREGEGENSTRGKRSALTYNASLMDFVVPNMDGPTASEVIRELGYSEPIFGVIVNAVCSDVNRHINQGAVSILSTELLIRFFR
jgi:CheY-like chemotaxis protein